MKVNFAFIHFLTQNFVIFFFSISEKFVVKIKFLSQFSVLANFIENIMKSLFVCIQGHGEEEISISVVYTYIFLLYLFYYSIYKGLIISFSLPIFWRERDRGVSHRVYEVLPFHFLLETTYYCLSDHWQRLISA